MIRINLLPVEEAARAAGRRENLALGTLVFGIAVAGFVAAHVWQGLRSSSAHRELVRVQTQLKAIEGPYANALHIEQQKQELREKLRVIGQLEAKKVGPVRILADLSSATPDKLWLTDFSDQGGTLRLTGIGVDEQTVADFLRRLGMLPFFQNVDLDEASQVDQDGAKLKKFVIRGRIDYGAPATAVAQGGAPGKPAQAGAGGAR
ncbi:MAG TPA: PilN domain-containing protein [Candidatus Limnocylindria bacterium]|jgi:type IV pilus assembly protein PilN|nr:PilN domain-containing protein [Candidatus Limnocylindria bacterium]